MGNVPSSKFSVFSEPDLFETNDQEKRPENNENSKTNHSTINRGNSKENIRRENLVGGENLQENSDLCSAEPVLRQSRSDLNNLSERNRKNFEEFEEQLKRTQEKRREIIAAKRKEMEDLRNEVKLLREENEYLKNINLERKDKENEAHGSELNLSKNSLEINLLKEENTRLQNLLKETEEVNKNLTEIKEESIISASETILSDTTSQIEKLTEQNNNLRNELSQKASQLENMSKLLEKNKELRISIAEMQCELQNLNKVVVDFEQEREEYKSHVVALKDVIQVSKKMLLIREGQLRELRQKVESIEETLSGKEMNLLSQDLRMEYERQLQSIRNLKTLYEERQRSDQKEKEELRLLLEETRKELESEKKKNEEAEERIRELEEQNSQKYDEIKSLESNLGLSKAESRQYQAELTVINQLFSEILLGFNTNQEIDLDKLTKHLEDHHGLLKEIVIKEISPAASSALPKMLLDLLSQLHDSKKNEETKQNAEKTEERLESHRLETITEEIESQTTSYGINSAEEIVELLPKVWRVLIELLSHQKVPTNILTEEKQPNHENPCYKTVQTPKGPSLVLSVSQTFIRLKDLILEKKSLEKETGHLKQLNGHLESRLQDQEKRLEMVSTELNKTWHVVGKLQKQHQLLHTQEKILRYELAQKRKLLSTLKQELEYSREKWQQAREKNSTTEKQWKQLRGEFAARRNIITEDFSNSVESGYSDEKCSSSDDEVEKGYESDISECAPQPVDNNNDTPLEVPQKTTNESGRLKNLDSNENTINKISDDNTNTYQETESLNNNESTNKPSNINRGLENDTSGSSNQKDNITENVITISDEKENTVNDETSNERNTGNSSRKSVTDVIYEELEQLLKNEERLANQIHSTEEKTSMKQSQTVCNEIEQSDVKPKKQSIVEEIWASKNDNIINTKDTHVVKDKDNLETNLSIDTHTNSDIPSTSSSKHTEKPKRTFDEIMAAKEARLKRLEGQCQQLVDKVTNTTNKREVVTNKLDRLHETYGDKSVGSGDVGQQENLPKDTDSKENEKQE